MGGIGTVRHEMDGAIGVGENGIWRSPGDSARYLVSLVLGMEAEFYLYISTSWYS